MKDILSLISTVVLTAGLVMICVMLAKSSGIEYPRAQFIGLLTGGFISLGLILAKWQVISYIEDK